MSWSLHKGNQLLARAADKSELQTHRRIVVAHWQTRWSSYWTRRLKGLEWRAWQKPSKTSRGALLPLKLTRDAFQSALGGSREDAGTTWSLNTDVKTGAFWAVKLKLESWIIVLRLSYSETSCWDQACWYCEQASCWYFGTKHQSWGVEWCDSRFLELDSGLRQIPTNCLDLINFIRTEVHLVQDPVFERTQQGWKLERNIYKADPACDAGLDE